MNYSNYRLTFDIHDIRSNIVVKVKRGDNTRRLCISLTENGKVYKISDKCTAVFKGKKADGKSLYNDCTIENNTILYVMGNNTTSVVGIVDCEVSLISEDGEVITSPSFTILVEDTAVHDDDVFDSSDEATALVELVAEATALKTEIETKLESGEFKGEKGDKGDKGEKGDSTLVTVDQEYSPESPNAQSGIAVAEAFAKLPIKYVESPDADGNTVCWRNLPSGTYALKGSFSPCFYSEDIVQLDGHPYFANIARGYRNGVNESHIQIYNPASNAMKYYICTNTAYTEQTIHFSKLANMETVEEMIAEAVGNYGVVNVLDYGAKGDGVTDDTEAIQKALHSAEDQNLPLYIPAGTYLVSKTISTYTRDTESDKQSKVLNIFGAGMNTKFVTTEDFEGDYVFHIDVAGAQPRQLWVHDFAIDLVADVSGIYFREIGMKGVVENLWITHLYDKDPTDTNVREGIYCESSTVTTFQRIKVYGNRKRISNGHENIGIFVHASYSTKFIDCDIIFCKWAIYLNSGTNNSIEYCRIDENEYGVYQNSTADTINYMPETRADNATDGSNWVENKGTLRNLTIRNNRFESNNQQAIFLASFGTGEMHYLYNAQVTIANNYFTGLGKHIALQTTDREVFSKAIRLFQCKGVVIENNCFNGQPYDESVEDTLLQNLVGERIEDITLRGNVATALPIWYDDGSHTIEKSNPMLSVEFVEATGFIPDIEADQSSRYSLGDVSLALDSIIAIQESLIGPTFITFTLGGTVYQAEEGMTWAEWCDSEYNTGGYWVDTETNYVCAANGDAVGMSDSNSDPNDVIVDGATYQNDL